MSQRMSLDVSLTAVDHLLDVPTLAEAAEAAGFDGLWASEVNHDPFLPLALAATRTNRLSLGTSIALSFTRSPMTLAYTCWDLAAATHGRFILGLGTQVKAHNERRFSVPWSEPVVRLREVIEGLRAIWRSWRTGDRLNFRGKHYQFTLMTPFFTPLNHEFEIPVTIAGVNSGLCRLAGEMCDGFHIHPLHSIKYLNEVVRPAVADGVGRAGRSLTDLSLIASAFVITGADSEQTSLMRETVRQQISFYASTPSYRIIFDTHDWGDVAEELSRRAAHKRWEEMPGLITDEMLDAFTIIAPPEEVGSTALRKYRGLVDRIQFYLPYQPGQFDRLWIAAVKAFADQA